ncbi:hypothetical protein HK096_005082, partial [Nowakowskiella sp. JEL0078]
LILICFIIPISSGFMEVKSDLNLTKTKITRSDEFPWCGLLINATNLNIRVDYSRYIDVRNSLTQSGGNPGKALYLKSVRTLVQKLKPSFLDLKLNSEST